MFGLCQTNFIKKKGARQGKVMGRQRFDFGLRIFKTTHPAFNPKSAIRIQKSQMNLPCLSRIDVRELETFGESGKAATILRDAS